MGMHTKAECGAKLRFSMRSYERLKLRDPERAEQYLRRAGGKCKLAPVPGRTRCYLHGGLSTGPRTEAGKQRIAVAVSKAHTTHGRQTKEAKALRKATALRITAHVERRRALALTLVGSGNDPRQGSG